MDINNFKNFYNNNNIKSAILATIFSRLISDTLYSFIDNILLPIIKIDLNYDGKPEINSIINKNVVIFNIKIKLFKFLLELFKLIFIIYILFKFNKYY